MAYENAAQPDLPPVEDWVNDWDWLDDQWGNNAIEIWNSVREVCPVATTERYGRAHMPVSMAAVSQIANDTENFSSIWVNVSRPDAPRRPAPPITSDPPEHHDHRRLMLPPFSPKKIAPMEDDMRRYARDLIGKLDGKDWAEGSDEYSQHIPVHGICQLLGISEDDSDMFCDWIWRNFQLGPRDNAVKVQVQTEMSAFFTKIIEERLENPRDDLMTLIAQSDVDMLHKVGYANLMIIAGIDTTWSALASGIWHFGQHPEERDRLAAADDDDTIWMTAIEEVLRYYAPVTMGRKVIKDVEVDGCPMHAGDQLLVTFPAANHDPEAFEDAHEFQIDRAKNRHVAFGMGIHRCLGSNLARMEMTVGLQEWIRAFPNYTLDTTQETKWANGQIRGPRFLPLNLNR